MTRVQRFPETLGHLLELVVVLNDDMTTSLARDGLTVSRASVLWQVRYRGPVTQRDLAEALGVSARTVTGLIDGLVATGFVTREPHPSDRRATLVTFTAHGARTVRRLEREQGEFTRILFEGLSDRQFDGFAHGLGHVLTQIKQHLPETTAAAGTVRRRAR
jgi:DNA-binding MarR family transcriptional regulator